MARRGKIVLLHFIGQMPLAGVAWQGVHYLLALERLGYDVSYVEDNGANPYDPRVNSVVMQRDYNVAYLRRIMERFGFDARWAYWDAVAGTHHGMSRAELHTLLAEADGLINLCGATRLRDEHLACPVRIMVDTDPAYEQFKYAKADPESRAYLEAHTHFFTYGENIGTPDSPVPLSGLNWRPTRPPVMPDHWPAAAGEPRCFTTIATWENKGKNIDYEGQTYYWSKHVNFVRFLDLPQRRPDLCFDMAILTPSEAAHREITGHGWRLIDPRALSSDLDAYQAFIAGSRGEFTVAKDIYARPNTGWSSDRSICYLASGRPVVTLATGASKFIPTGRGLFDYTTAEGALAALDAIAADYPLHSRAARELAQEYFAGERVVGKMMAEAGL